MSQLILVVEPINCYLSQNHQPQSAFARFLAVSNSTLCLICFVSKFFEMADGVADNIIVAREGLVRLCIAQQAPELCNDKPSGALSKAANLAAFVIDIASGCPESLCGL